MPPLPACCCTAMSTAPRTRAREETRCATSCLFARTHACRSQIAQAFFERRAPADLRAESAGQQPANAIWPNVVEAMHEVGIDISDRKPKKIEVEMQLHADKAITLNCQGTCPYVLGGIEDWEVGDPYHHRGLARELRRHGGLQRARKPRKKKDSSEDRRPGMPAGTRARALKYLPSNAGSAFKSVCWIRCCLAQQPERPSSPAGSHGARRRRRRRVARCFS